MEDSIQGEGKREVIQIGANGGGDSGERGRERAGCG